MDDSFAANQTMIKLINAAKRGVNCVVMCDDLNQNIKKDLKTKFQLHGGKIYSLNRINWWNLFYKFRIKSARHHEKVISIDNTNYIGSANISDKYASIKYGNVAY